MRRALPLLLLLLACAKNDIAADPSLDGGRSQTGPGPNPDQTGPMQGSGSGTRLKARTLKGEDGSTQFVGWYDSERQENCGFILSGDGKTRCLPERTVQDSAYYKDSGCSQKVPLEIKNCTGDPTVVKVIAGAGCAAGYKAVNVTKHTGPVYSGIPGSCTEVKTGLEAFTFFTVGADVPLTSFVAATEEH